MTVTVTTDDKALAATLAQVTAEAFWDASLELIRAEDDLRECARVGRSTYSDAERVKEARVRWDRLKATGLNVPIGPNGRKRRPRP